MRPSPSVNTIASSSFAVAAEHRSSSRIRGSRGLLAEDAAVLGFVATRRTIEVEGMCARVRSKPAMRHRAESGNCTHGNPVSGWIVAAAGRDRHHATGSNGMKFAVRPIASAAAARRRFPACRRGPDPVAALWIALLLGYVHAGAAVTYALQFQDLTLGYDRHPAVHRLHGEIAEGSLTAVVGPNGAGKTTMLKGVIGALRPLEGQDRLRRTHAEPDRLPAAAI